MDETVASGMVPYHHLIGGESGMGEDRRGLEPAHKYFNWLARHDGHFINKRSIANIGVVMGQRTHLFYAPPRGVTMSHYMDGMYYALLEGRFLFDFVHEDSFSPENRCAFPILSSRTMMKDLSAGSGKPAFSAITFAARATVSIVRWPSASHIAASSIRFSSSLAR